MKAIRFPAAAWYRYKCFVENAVSQNNLEDTEDVDGWREKLLINCILYAIPVSFLALVPSVIVLANAGYQFLPAFDVFIVVAITTVTFNKRLPLRFRKAFIVIAFYLLSVTVIEILGAFGVGSLYLLALSVFISLLYCQRAVYWSVMANFAIYTAFALIIHYRLFNSPLIAKYTLDFWIVYSCNFLFLNIATIIQVRYVINGLENAIDKEACLRKDLQFEASERVKQTELLIESEEHYRSLFYGNPSPMWIYDINSLQFLQVNKAAVAKYGYSQKEFMNMTIKDIRPDNQVNELLKLLGGIHNNFGPVVNTVMHRRKSGEEFYVEVRCSTIPFKGKEARLVIVRDISAHMQYVEAIERQNHKLQQIAFMQSHIVRAPLCRIMGLVDLIMKNKEKPEYEMMEYLDVSVKELDDVIKTIIQTTDTSENAA